MIPLTCIDLHYPVEHQDDPDDQDDVRDVLDAEPVLSAPVGPRPDHRPGGPPASRPRHQPHTER